jgi:hypothetical protein
MMAVGMQMPAAFVIVRLRQTCLAVQDVQEFVILLGIVIDPELPVAADFRAVKVEDFQLLVLRKMQADIVGDRPQEIRQRRDVVVDRYEHQPAEHLCPDRPQAYIVFRQPDRFVPFGPGDAGAGTLQIERPQMVETLDTLAERTALVPRQRRAAMRTDIEEGADVAGTAICLIPAPHHQDRPPAQSQRPVTAGFRQLGLMTHQLPAPGEYPRLLVIEDRRIGEDAVVDVMGGRQIWAGFPAGDTVVHLGHLW